MIESYRQNEIKGTAASCEKIFLLKLLATNEKPSLAAFFLKDMPMFAPTWPHLLKKKKLSHPNLLNKTFQLLQNQNKVFQVFRKKYNTLLQLQSLKKDTIVLRRTFILNVIYFFGVVLTTLIQ